MTHFAAVRRSKDADNVVDADKDDIDVKMKEERNEEEFTQKSSQDLADVDPRDCEEAVSLVNYRKCHVNCYRK